MLTYLSLFDSLLLEIKILLIIILLVFCSSGGGSRVVASCSHFWHFFVQWHLRTISKFLIYFVLFLHSMRTLRRRVIFGVQHRLPHPPTHFAYFTGCRERQSPSV